ncbi:helix-turn-helix transcriptional regulator [Cryptosporangium minutisporangium]|uniref:Helix-turn-helix transcriptional regulator n=1 Tax=Cryptosporangium minutisporangium TaxID=113569 RepID=A0ABP6SWH0_9ACTN
MVGERTPTLRRRELAARLRALRHASGKTIEEVARELLCSPTKISRIETGRRGAVLRDVRDLCRLYDVSPAEQEHLMALARESKERAWWQGYDIDASYRTLIGLESAATAISDYQPNVVPGLLQTPDYARALIRGAGERRTEQEIEEKVTLRISRQRILDRPEPPYVSFIIDESATRRLVGGREVMVRQLDALLAACERPQIGLQVLDFEAGAHPGLPGSFGIAEIEESPASSIVFVEGHQGDFYLEGSADLKRYRRIFDQLRSIALSPKSSVEFITAVRDQIRASEPR